MVLFIIISLVVGAVSNGEGFVPTLIVLSLLYFASFLKNRSEDERYREITRQQLPPDTKKIAESRKLIANGMLEESIDLLIDTFEECKDLKKLNEIITIKSTYLKIQSEKRVGVIDDDQKYMREARISSALLELTIDKSFQI